MKLFTDRYRRSLLTFGIIFVSYFTVSFIAFKDPKLILFYIVGGIIIATLLTIMFDTNRSMKKNVKSLNKMSDTIDSLCDKLDEVTKKIEEKENK